MITVLLSSALIISVFLYLYILSKSKPKNFPPGPPRLPFWGSYWYLLKEDYNFPHKSLETLGKKYDTDIVGFYLGDTPAISPLSYELCRESLIKEEFIGRNDTIITRDRGLGQPRGIFFLDGPEWKVQRRFSLRNLRNFGFGRRSAVVEQFVTDEVRSIIELIMSEPNKEDTDVFPEKGIALMPDMLYGPLLNSIFLLLSSSKFDNKDLIDIGRAGLRFQRSGDPTGSAISITPWLRYIAPEYFGYNTAVRENKYMLGFLKEIIDQHRKTFIPDHCRDFIDVFIKEQMERESVNEVDSFTDKQLLLTVLDYMFPAAIAIGHTLNFHFINLINNPHVQVKIQNEIDRVVGRSRLPNLDDRPLMPYIEASIRESVRFLPLNPLGIPRRCMEDTYFAGYFIPKDTIVLPNVYTAHKDTGVWTNPEIYRPERFLDESGNLIKKDLTLGFGAGKRLCAGETFARQNMFLIVSGLLQNFTLSSGCDKPLDLKNVVSGVNLSVENSYIKFVSR